MLKKSLLSLCLLPLPLLANEPASPWSFKAEGGLSITSGNSKSENLFLGLKAGYAQAQNELNAEARLDRTRSEDALTKDYRLVSTTARHFFNRERRFYGYGDLRWEQDEPAGMNTNTNVTLGPGWRWTLPQNATLNVELGGGYQNSDYADNGKDFSGVVGRFYSALKAPINTIVTFLADTLFLANEKRTQNTSHLKLESKLTARLALSTEFEYRYNSNPDTGKKKEDTTLRAAFTYQF